MTRFFVIVVMGLFAAWTGVLGGCASRGAKPEAAKPMVGMWVTRWDYRSPADVRSAIKNAASVGVTDVFWQVRGQGDAFYRSDVEPWSRDLFKDLPANATDPGYDPLKLAVTLARAQGVRLHAWVNVMPMWRGKTAPKDPGHMFNAHPEWRLKDAKGVPQPLHDHYVIVNPVLPEVHAHIVRVVKDIASRYEVDGVHLDYIRFVSDTMAEPAAYPGDPASVALFTAATGRRGLESAEDKAAFRAFKREQITAIVRKIRLALDDARPGIELSAAVWRNPVTARETYLQDGPLWMSEGLVDRVMPMIYTDKDADYAKDLAAWRALPTRAAISPGIAAYMHKPEQTPEQIRLSEGTDGFVMFAYSSFFESPDAGQDRTPAAASQRIARRQALAAVLPPNASATAVARAGGSARAPARGVGAGAGGSTAGAGTADGSP